tara:strand:- start:183 stop:413 length:231 start_codon:yes stop_codon:yes gene_type:complete
MRNSNFGALSDAGKALGFDLQKSFSTGLNDFFAKEPEGKKLKKEILTRLSIYSAAPYFVAGLLGGFLLFKALDKTP